MSKFFTYEDRLEVQKYLKESLSMKAIARELGKDPTTISREIKKYSSEVATGHPGFPFNECKNRKLCRLKIFVVKIAPTNQPCTASCVENAINSVKSLREKSVLPVSAHLMYVMDVLLLTNAL